MNNPSTKRSIKHYLILPSYQLRLILFLAAIILLGCLLNATGLYLIISRNLQQNFSIVQTEQIWEIIRPAVVVSNICCFVIIMVFLVILSVLISHKIVGPMLKVTGHINKMNSGVLPKNELKLRDGDEGQVLCDAVNKLQGNIGEQVKRLKAISESLKDGSVDTQKASAELDEIIDNVKAEE